MLEKRKYNRLYREFFVRFGLDQPDNAGMTLDISSRGMFIKSDIIFPNQTTLNIQLFLSDTLTVHLTGIVLWRKHIPSSENNPSSSQGMGIHFFRIPKEYEAFLKSVPKNGELSD